MRYKTNRGGPKVRNPSSTIASVGFLDQDGLIKTYPPFASLGLYGLMAQAQ